MNGRPWLWLIFWVIAIVGGPFAGAARADSASVTVLGVRSLDGEDQLERRVSHAVRNAARSVEGYRVSDREVSLAQMSLAHGCEEVDVPCLKDIAATLSADRLIYGNLVRSGDKVRITLFNFDARSSQIDGSTERTVLAAQLAEPTLSEIALAAVQRLSGKRNAVGTLRITGNRPGAAVALDGKPAGELDANGELTIAQVEEGAHSVHVSSSDGRDQRDLSIEVRADTTTTLRALLTPPLPAVSEEPQPGPVATPEERLARSRKLKRIFGWTSVGLAAGFAVATIYSWVRIGNIEDDKTLLRYASYWPEEGPLATNDACVEAINGEIEKGNGVNPPTEDTVDDERTARSLCNEADKLETLQYVFAGGTLLFAGVGTWLLWDGYRKEPATLSVRPRFGVQSASLSATLRF